MVYWRSEIIKRIKACICGVMRVFDCNENSNNVSSQCRRDVVLVRHLR